MVCSGRVPDQSKDATAQQSGEEDASLLKQGPVLVRAQ
jgi:hypothetical protein